MAITRKWKIAIFLSASVVSSLVLGISGLHWIGDRISESDLIWVGTRQFGMRLIIYAEQHGGRYPVTLADTNLVADLSPDDRIYLQRLKFDYTQPRPGDTNIVKLLVGHSQTMISSFYSDGSVEVAKR